MTYRQILVTLMHPTVALQQRCSDKNEINVSMLHRHPFWDKM